MRLGGKLIIDKSLLIECSFQDDYDLKIESNNNFLNFENVKDLPNFNNSLIFLE